MNENIDSIKESTKEDFRQINQKIENVSDTFRQRVDEYKEEVKQQIAETKERLEKTDEIIVQLRVEVDAKIDQVENNNQVRVCLLYTSRCV